ILPLLSFQTVWDVVVYASVTSAKPFSFNISINFLPLLSSTNKSISLCTLVSSSNNASTPQPPSIQMLILFSSAYVIISMASVFIYHATPPFNLKFISDKSRSYYAKDEVCLFLLAIIRPKSTLQQPPQF